MSTQVAITGASGFVGSHLARELQKRGHRVRALLRPSSSRELIGDLTLDEVSGDLHDSAALDRCFEGCDAVFHLAALFREAKFPDSEYFRVNVEGTRNVLESARRCGVRRVVHCSTNGVLGPARGAPLADDAPYNPGDMYQVSKVEGEKLVLSWDTARGPEVVVIRPAMIWGPGDKRILKLFRGIARRRLPIIGNGKTHFHWVHVDDLVDAFIKAGAAPGVSGQAFLIGGARIVTLEETFRAVADILQVPLFPFKLPHLPFYIAGAICEALCAPLGIEPPIYRRRAEFFIKSRAFDCSKAHALLGYRNSRTFEEEARQIIGWYQEKGWL